MRVTLHALLETFLKMKDKVITQISSWEDAVLWLKAQPDQYELVQACFYDDPIQKAAGRYHQSAEWQALKAYLPPPGRMLDIGSGRGISAYAFAKDGWKVDALEPDGSDVVGAGAIKSLAESCALGINVEQTWGEQLPYADATFDLVFGRQVLHHAKDLGALCKEAARVLKPNGMYIFTREHVISKHEDLDLFLENHSLHKLYGGEHAYLQKDYIKAIEASGIRLKAVLNPMESNINLHPQTVGGIKMQISNKTGIPARVIPNVLINLIGSLSNAPGRLYSFIGHKI